MNNLEPANVMKSTATVEELVAAARESGMVGRAHMDELASLDGFRTGPQNSNLDSRTDKRNRVVHKFPAKIADAALFCHVG